MSNSNLMAGSSGEYSHDIIKDHHHHQSAPPLLGGKTTTSSPLYDLLCSNCRLPVIDTRQTDCGCRICGACAEKLSGNSVYICDKCASKTSVVKSFKDRAIENELKRLSFPCYNTKCPWTGSNTAYRSHVSSCKFADLNCPNSGCDIVMGVRELEEHLKTCQYKEISCRWCKATITMKTKKMHESKDCPEYRIPCPNTGCDQKFPRKMLDEHLLKECRKHKRHCQYSNLGCTFQGNVDQLHQHNITEVSKHLDLVVKQVSLLNSSDRPVQRDSRGVSLEMRVKDSDKKMMNVHSELLSLKDEMNRRLHPISDGLMKVESVMHDFQESFQELALLVQTLQATSYNGTFIWKIPDVKRRREEAMLGKTVSLYSAPFYTSRFGYKLCLRVYMDGDGSGKGSHISYFVTLMKGEYDALLQWPFNQMVTLMLLDQSSAKKHIVQCFKPEPTSSSFWRPQSDMNVASGCPKFVSLSVLNDPNYVKDDTMFFKAVVDLAGLNHP